METFDVALMDRKSWGQDVVSHRFERPVDYAFEAGQFLLLDLETADGHERKPFTIASAPGDDWLEVTTRMSGSPFKSALAALEPGQPATLSRPAGKFVLPGNGEPVGFLAGGVGITPVRSMLRHAVATSMPVDGMVFFGNRDVDCIPYRDELDAMAPRGIVTVHVLQQPPETWTGERGFIDAALVSRYVDDAARWRWVVTGPPAMVAAMEAVLDELGVKPDRRLIERFTGYA